MLDRAASPSLGFDRPAPLPVEALVVGKPVADVADLLPRLFSLCRAAQGAAARLALGQAPAPDMKAELRREAMRDHLMKFHLSWPGQFGEAARPSPEGWPHGGTAMAHQLFGPAGQMPRNPDDLMAFLNTSHGIAPVLSKIRAVFAGGAGEAPRLPWPDDADPLTLAAIENSVAARQRDHPLLTAVEAENGRGPFWRALARAVDLEALMRGDIPDPVGPARGVALVPASRGRYALKIDARDGVVTGLTRVTPTDHLMAKGGILDHALAALPVTSHGLAPLLLDILDPCTPLRVKEVAHA